MQERQAIEWACRSCIIITSAIFAPECNGYVLPRKNSSFHYGRPP